MNLVKYDGKCVRITCDNDDIFEGFCVYDNAEYNGCEYGREQESLDIENFKFYKDFIKKVESLENHNGPYGHFTYKYGTLEKMNFEDGLESINDILFSEEDEHAYRMLVYLEDHLDYIDRSKIKIQLENLLKYSESKKVLDKTKLLVKMINEKE